MPNALVTSDPEIMLGKPVVAGTRITVEFILEQLAAGDTVENIVVQYSLTLEQVQAALLFAAELARFERVEPIPRAS